MDFRRKQQNSLSLPIYEHLSDLLEETLCSKLENRMHHAKECIQRECERCSVEKFRVLPEETDMSEDAPDVKWKKFEYVSNGQTQDGKTKKRLQLVDKITKPGELFACFQNPLTTYTAHSFRAQWQHQQLQELTRQLPPHHVVTVHDYSENYNCQMQDQLQSLYFSQVQASVHVTVLKRHAIKEIDGMNSTEEKPNIITEHIFVILPDCRHDHDSVQQVHVLL